MRTFAFGDYGTAQIQAFKTNNKSLEREKYKHVENIALESLISTTTVPHSQTCKKLYTFPVLKKETKYNHTNQKNCNCYHQKLTLAMQI